jgi:hypothetical protein
MAPCSFVCHQNLETIKFTSSSGYIIYVLKMEAESFFEILLTTKLTQKVTILIRVNLLHILVYRLVRIRRVFSDFKLHMLFVSPGVQKYGRLVARGTKGLQLATISNSTSKIWPSQALEIAIGILMKSSVILKEIPFENSMSSVFLTRKN